MSTATPTEPTHGHTTPAGGAAEPALHDPTKDIDAKKTVIVLALCTAFVFGSVWIMSAIFSFVVAGQRYEKVENAPTPQRDELTAWEDTMLDAGNDPKRKSIEQSIQELVNK